MRKKYRLQMDRKKGLLQCLSNCAQQKQMLSDLSSYFTEKLPTQLCEVTKQFLIESLCQLMAKNERMRTNLKALMPISMMYARCSSSSSGYFLSSLL